MKVAERKHLSRIADMGCVACLIDGYSDTPAEIHHVRQGMGMSQRNNHYKTIPLCPAHHRGTLGNRVPSIHGSPAAFLRRYGTELELLTRVEMLLEIKKVS